jgi:hypothetical protein
MVAYAPVGGVFSNQSLVELRNNVTINYLITQPMYNLELGMIMVVPAILS